MFFHSNYPPRYASKCSAMCYESDPLALARVVRCPHPGYRQHDPRLQRLFFWTNNSSKNSTTTRTVRPPPKKNAIKWVPKKPFFLLFFDSFIIKLGHVQWFVVWISVPGKFCWVSSLPLCETDISLASSQRAWYVNSRPEIKTHLFSRKYWIYKDFTNILQYLSISGKCVPGHVIMHTAKLPHPGHTMKGLFTALPGNGIWVGWISQSLMFN